MGKLSLSSWRAKHLSGPWKVSETTVTNVRTTEPESNKIATLEKANHGEHSENIAEVHLDTSANAASERISSNGNVKEDDDPTEALPFQSKRLPDESLPLILATIVEKRDGKRNESGRQNRLCTYLPTFLLSLTMTYFPSHLTSCPGIVVNNVVLDVTEYHVKHPGGRAIISGFGGQDCTWQWFSFHSVDIWRSVAAGLRIGRTENVTNPFQRPKGIVGLRGHGFQDWD